MIYLIIAVITGGCKMDKLFTIGYEGADLKEFLTVLKNAGTDVLLDVRELPMSRRKGFSKNALKAALAEVGIDYRHEKRLGSPKDVCRLAVTSLGPLTGWHNYNPSTRACAEVICEPQHTFNLRSQLCTREQFSPHVDRGFDRPAPSHA